jgi:NodT family efflux transporter outer membrane factor (OMF) lipoprotein
MLWGETRLGATLGAAWSAAWSATLVAGLSGCALLNAPDLPLPAGEVPAFQLPERWRGPQAEPGEMPETWWQRFEDPALDRFINQALHDNAKLAIGLQRLRQARLKAQRASADLKPAYSLGLSASANQPLRWGQGLGQSTALSAGLSYEVDLWGKLAAARSVAQFEASATAEDQQALALSVVGEVATQHWDLALLNEQLALVEAELDDTQWMLTIARVRSSAGAIPATDVTEIEQLLDSLRLQRLQVRRDRANARQALALLLGIWPELPVGERTEVPRSTPPAVPAGLPAALVTRRPDVRAAQLRLQAQRRSVDEARAALSPSLSLSASVDSGGEHLLKLLANPALTLGAGLLVPVLQGERLALDLEVSRSEADEAAIHFRQSVLQALGEVETALQERAYLSERAALLARSLAVAEKGEKVARSRFEAGLSGVLPWLEQRKQRREAVLALAKGRRDLLAAQMQLYQSLGGDVGLSAQALPNLAGELDGLPGVAPVRRVVLPSESAPPKTVAPGAARGASAPVAAPAASAVL